MQIAVSGAFMRWGGRAMFHTAVLLWNKSWNILRNLSHADLAANLAAAVRPSTPKGVGPKALDGPRLTAASLASRSSGSVPGEDRGSAPRFWTGGRRERRGIWNLFEFDGVDRDPAP
jgi:hypothetical protein